jgi:hypothetical protein
MKVNISGCTRSAQENTLQISVKVSSSNFRFRQKGITQKTHAEEKTNEFDSRLVTSSRKSLALFAQQTSFFAVTRSVPRIVMICAVNMSPFVTKRTNVQCGCNFLEQPFQYCSFVGFYKWV